MSGPRLVVCGIAAVAAIWASILLGVNSAVDKAIFRESIDKATHWGNHMARRIPDIETLVETGIPTEEQRLAVNEVKQLGDIFRFKLFSADGRLSMVSDAPSSGVYTGISDKADPEPQIVAQTKQAIVDLYDGTNKPDRPDLYAEAYVPLIGSNNRLVGVVEVYVDQTETAAYFKESFQSFAILLMLLCGTIFAAPSIAYFIQRKLAQRSYKNAEFLARFDPLTGLMNRREFAVQAQAYVMNGVMTVACYLDLDHFKKINDTYGHAVGDAYLAHIATVLRDNCRKEDLLARFGGDEFVIGFHNLSIEDATQKIRTILNLCASQIELEDATLNGSVSIGLVDVQPDDDLERALKNADTALYYAKTSGRNTFAIYGDEMGEELRRRYALEMRIRQATRQRDFEIFFQPLVESRDKQVIGYEALLRLLDTNGDVISPTVFIPVAESLGLIDEIGQWTIEVAIQHVSKTLDGKILAINLSAIQFESGELVEIVRNALEKNGFPANQLELEITESLLMEDSIAVEMQIDALREMGVRIAMDDFGTGFSSLSYLWKYGFDRLKIDRSFVAALDEDSERSREIIESVVMLGSRLNMKITAEGVETAEQSKFLTDLGCDTLQGYLFGKPLPFEHETKNDETLPQRSA